jgi:hypothetical protein
MDYPWYETIEGEELEQGDILENCLVFLPVEAGGNLRVREWKSNVMSQSCDLVKGREKFDNLVLCRVAASQ